MAVGIWCKWSWRILKLSSHTPGDNRGNCDNPTVNTVDIQFETASRCL